MNEDTPLEFFVSWGCIALISGMFIGFIIRQGVLWQFLQSLL